MLPRTPPTQPSSPAYPSRDRLLQDPGLRRHAIAVLAAAALSGCANSTANPPPSGTPAPGPELGRTAPPTPLGGSTPIPAPQHLEGDVAAPQPPPIQRLRGEASVPEQPAPTRLQGAPLPPPPPATVKP